MKPKNLSLMWVPTHVRDIIKSEAALKGLTIGSYLEREMTGKCKQKNDRFKNGLF